MVLPARTPREAFILRRIAVSQSLQCVTDAHLDVRIRGVDGTTPITVILNRLIPAPLSAPTPLAFTLRMIWHTVRQESGWIARTGTYYYTLHDERHEILAYHWHPEQTPSIAFPHLHLEAGAGVQRAELTRAHLPTGGVTLTAFLRMAIRDFGVEPRRNDWQNVLEHNEAEPVTTRDTQQ